MAKPKAIELALQGGGSHGAFTWGVLDRLLADDRIEIEGICGTSAGAMNAVAVADGLDTGGREGARQALARFWSGVHKAGLLSPFGRTWLDMVLGRWTLDFSPGYIFFEALSRAASPYQLNPFNINPLRDLISSLVDFEHVRHAEGIKLFVVATDVRTGMQKVFRREEMTADMVLASACLPFAFQAVEIAGEAYWDGGYMGNPALFPLVDGCQSRDIVIVQINPLYREKLPLTAPEIFNRINEITFNASLIKEVRAIAMMKESVGTEGLEGGRFKDVLFHRIDADDALRELGVSSKFNTEWAFLKHLHGIGYRAASDWLDGCYDDLGKRSTLDIESVYLGWKEGNL